MGKVRLGFLTILGSLLSFSILINPIDSAFARGSACVSVFSKPQDIRAFIPGQGGLRNNTKLKIVTWNVLDLKIPEAEYPAGSEAARNTSQRDQTQFAKSEGQLLMMKRVMEDMDADIYVLQEVFSRESLKYVVEKYLGDKYEVVIEKGNDERGINVGFLVKKTLNVSFELQSHKDLRFKQNYGVYPAGLPIFARDLPALYLRQKDGSNSRASDDPDLVVLGAHFKSKRSTNGDFESTNRREVEAQSAAKIVMELDKQFGGKVPVLLAGDFNTRIMEASETKALRENLKESLSLMGDKLTYDDKVTHTYHPFKRRMDAKQVDAQLLNDALAGKLVKSYVYHYKDQNGQDKVYTGKWESKSYPLTIGHRKQNPSDHMPIVAIYDMTK